MKSTMDKSSIELNAFE